MSLYYDEDEIATIKLLLSDPMADPNTTIFGGHTPLVYACNIKCT